MTNPFASLPARLIDSLDPTTENGVEFAWEAEIQKRLEDIDQGRVVSVPRSEARRLLREDADEPSEA